MPFIWFNCWCYETHQHATNVGFKVLKGIKREWTWGISIIRSEILNISNNFNVAIKSSPKVNFRVVLTYFFEKIQANHLLHIGNKFSLFLLKNLFVRTISVIFSSTLRTLQGHFGAKGVSRQIPVRESQGYICCPL